MPDMKTGPTGCLAIAPSRYSTTKTGVRQYRLIKSAVGIEASILDTSQLSDVFLPACDVVFVELVQMVVTTPLSQDLHQFYGRMKESVKTFRSFNGGPETSGNRHSIVNDLTRQKDAAIYSLAAFAMYITVSIQKINACIIPENQSKYTDKIAGIPTSRTGICDNTSPTSPGINPRSAELATASAP